MEKSIDDIEFRKLVLKMHDEGYIRDEIVRKLDIKKSCYDNIIGTFHNNGLSVDAKLNNDPFTKEEDKIILDNVDEDIKVLIKKLNRTYFKVKGRKHYLKKNNETKKEKTAKNINVNSGKFFKEEEILFIKERYEAGDKVEDIARVLGRSKLSIAKACVNRKIKRLNSHNRIIQKKYTDKDVDIVKKCIENGLKNKEIMKKMDISEGKLARIIKENGLQRKQTKEKIRRAPENLNIPNGYKYCLICEEIKPLNSFSALARNKDGKRPWCKECEKKRVKELKENKKNGK